MTFGSDDPANRPPSREAKAASRLMVHDEYPQTPEERELAEKRAALALLETELVERELELSTLQQELASFEAEYLRIVGTRYADLDEINAQIKEAQATRLPGDESAQEEAHAARETAAASAAEMGRESHLEAPVPFHPSASLKSLYKSAARRLHPDLAATDEQRQRRHEWMVKLNEAYKNQDEAALQALIAEWDTSPDAVEGEGVGSDLVRVIRQATSVKKRLEDLSQAIDTLKASDLWALHAKWQAAREAGRDLFAEQVAEIDRQIADARQVLADLQEQAT